MSPTFNLSTLVQLPLRVVEKLGGRVLSTTGNFYFFISIHCNKMIYVRIKLQNLTCKHQGSPAYLDLLLTAIVTGTGSFIWPRTVDLGKTISGFEAEKFL